MRDDVIECEIVCTFASYFTCDANIQTGRIRCFAKSKKNNEKIKIHHKYIPNNIKHDFEKKKA